MQSTTAWYSTVAPGQGLVAGSWLQGVHELVVPPVDVELVELPDELELPACPLEVLPWPPLP